MVRNRFAGWTRLPVSAAWARLPVSAGWARLPVSAAWTRLPVSAAWTRLPVSADWTRLPVSADWTRLPVSAGWTRLPVSADWTRLPGSAGRRPTLAGPGHGSQVLAARSVSGRDDDVGHRKDEDDERDPVVEAQPAESVGRVDSQVFDPCSAEGVASDIQREESTVSQLIAPLGPDQHSREREHPQRLVKESWVEGRVVLVAGDPLIQVDLQSPGEISWFAIELLVEPVAPTADGLGDGDAWRRHVGHRGQRDTLPPAGDPGAERSPRDRTPDPDATLPDCKGLPGMAAGTEIWIRSCDHMVDPRPDDPEWHRPDRNFADDSSPTAAGVPAALADPHRSDHAQDDAERVAADRERAEVPDAAGRAGDVRNVHNAPNVTLPDPRPRRHPCPVALLGLIRRSVVGSRSASSRRASLRWRRR